MPVEFKTYTAVIPDEPSDEEAKAAIAKEKRKIKKMTKKNRERFDKNQGSFDTWIQEHQRYSPPSGQDKTSKIESLKDRSRVVGGFPATQSLKQRILSYNPKMGLAGVAPVDLFALPTGSLASNNRPGPCSANLRSDLEDQHGSLEEIKEEFRVLLQGWNAVDSADHITQGHVRTSDTGDCSNDVVMRPPNSVATEIIDRPFLLSDEYIQGNDESASYHAPAVAQPDQDPALQQSRDEDIAMRQSSPLSDLPESDPEAGPANANDDVLSLNDDDGDDAKQESNVYGTEITRVVTIVSYDGHRHDVHASDWERLKGTHWYNDALIEMFLHFFCLDNTFVKMWGSNVLITSPFLWGKLTSNDPSAVMEVSKRWFRNIDIFTKEYVIIAACQRLEHWYLMIIAGLKEVANNPKKPVRIFLLDSKAGTADSVVSRETMHKFLNLMLKNQQNIVSTTPKPRRRKGQKKCDLSTVKEITTTLVTPKVPSQPNYYDCGVYTVLFARRFIQEPSTCLSLLESSGLGQSEAQLRKDWKIPKKPRAYLDGLAKEIAAAHPPKRTRGKKQIP